jgi:putative ABC transport system permease protein
MLIFKLKRTFKSGIKSLWVHRLRSMLTALGIVFGVCSVIAMLAIGEGASQEAQQAIAKLGSTNLIIETVEPPSEQPDSSKSNTMRTYGLTYTDAESIHNTIPDVKVVVPIRQMDSEARYLNRRSSVKITGTVPWYTEITELRINRGRFLSSIDLNQQQGVCVIDATVADELFMFDDPLEKDIKISGSFYHIVGISESSASAEQQSSSAENASITSRSKAAAGNIYIPLTTARIRFSEITASFSGSSPSMAKVELQKITVKVGSTEQVVPMRDTLASLLERLHNSKKDYRIVVPLELLREAAHRRRIFSIVLGSIAAISLLVGGIGIMNIMLATVSERTREIGIRRALGARKRDIVVQFLSETLLLTLSGGVVGIILGSIIPFLVEQFSNMPTVITGSSLVLSFGISAAVGIIFGLYPACRAANMDPIESLRHE